MEILTRISNALEIPLRWFGIVLMGIIVIFTFIDVLARYVFHSSLSFAEWSAWAMVICTFIMAAMVTKGNKHINVDIILRYLPKRGQNAVIIVGSLAIIFFSVILILSGIKLVKMQMELDIVSTGLLEVPIWIPRAFVPLSALFMAFYAVEEMLKAIVAICSNDGR